MQVAVWDTYVTKKDGTVMHFDIIAPKTISDAQQIYTFGKTYLTEKGIGELAITANECQFCHVENVRPQWEAEILKKGYYIYEMENCN